MMYSDHVTCKGPVLVNVFFPLNLFTFYNYCQSTSLRISVSDRYRTFSYRKGNKFLKICSKENLKNA